jgi:hypothetical protein
VRVETTLIEKDTGKSVDWKRQNKGEKIGNVVVNCYAIIKG